MVRASLLLRAHRETHDDVYAARRPRLGGSVDVEQVTESIRDLGALLVAARSSEERAWLVLRLRNRLDALDALEGRS